jgi:hypothetical protein
MRFVQRALLFTALVMALARWVGGQGEREVRFDVDLGAFSALLSFHPGAAVN